MSACLLELCNVIFIALIHVGVKKQKFRLQSNKMLTYGQCNIPYKPSTPDFRLHNKDINSKQAHVYNTVK